MRTSRSAISLLAAILYTPVALAAIALFAVAVVPHSRYFAVALVSLWPTLFLFASASPKALRYGTFPFLIFLASLTAATLSSPSGTQPDSAPFTSHTFDASPPLRSRLSPSNLVAEVDQLRFGTLLIKHLDPHIDGPQATRLLDLTTAVYADLHANSPSLVAAGSQLGTCYHDILDPPQSQNHFYRYDPPGAPTPRPAIIFLHGSLGNFQAYIHLLKPVADQLGTTLIAPTFGQGNWSRPDGLQTIQNALDHCLSQPDIDPTNITLIGLSNGGIGVTRALAELPNSFRAFVYLSPVIPTGLIRSAPPETPVLVIHGTTDRRIPLTSVQSATTHLETLGCQVTTHLHPEQDHFLLFSKPDLVTTQITTWLQKQN